MALTEGDLMASRRVSTATIASRGRRNTAESLAGNSTRSQKMKINGFDEGKGKLLPFVTTDDAGRKSKPADEEAGDKKRS